MRTRLAVLVLLLSALVGSVAKSAELDLTGRWKMAPDGGPDKALASLTFVKKDGQWSGVWRTSATEVPLADIEVTETRLKFRITAQPNTFFVGELNEKGEIAGEITMPAGTRRTVARRVPPEAAPEHH